MASGAYTNTHTRILSRAKVIIRNQVCAGLQPVHAWLKIEKKIGIEYIYKSKETSQAIHEFSATNDSWPLAPNFSIWPTKIYFDQSTSPHIFNGTTV